MSANKSSFTTIKNDLKEILSDDYNLFNCGAYVFETNLRDGLVQRISINMQKFEPSFE
jgi:hypothetical protein